MTTNKKKCLAEKLLAIQESVNYLRKDNRGHQYDYVSSSQTLGAVRAAMDSERVLLTLSVEQTHREERETAKGAKEYFTELWIVFTWINVDDPAETLTCKWYGQGIDQSEKGVGKAFTYAEKYFLLKTFHVATDKDDPDAFQAKHARDPETPEALAEPPATKPKQKRAAKEPEPATERKANEEQRDQMKRYIVDERVDPGWKARLLQYVANPALSTVTATKALMALGEKYGAPEQANAS